jgi:hypothetical protein
VVVLRWKKARCQKEGNHDQFSKPVHTRLDAEFTSVVP